MPLPVTTSEKAMWLAPGTHVVAFESGLPRQIAASRPACLAACTALRRSVRCFLWSLL
jgi:hypothetical protein